MRQPEQALDVYKRSLQLNPNQPLANRNLGLLYEQLHRLDDARHHATLAIEQAPDEIEAHILLAKLDAREQNAAAAKERLQALLERNLKPFHRAAVSLELGKILDRQGRISMAFEYLRAGKDGFSKLYKVDKSENLAYRDAIDGFRTVFTREATNGWTRQALKDPLKVIFPVGFPRSGTTLTEQILESHPQVTATHGLPALVDMSGMLERLLGRPFDYPKDVPGLSVEEITRLRQFYLMSMQKALQDKIGPSRYLLDKLPLNMIHLGLIIRLFPEARILVALRDPRDVCLSCYLQSFEMNPAMSQFLDINDTADFYSNVMGLWLHYRQTLDLNYLETRYEALVENPEQAARNMLDFIGLPWNASVLDYHRQARQRRVYTPSYEAVTQPVYTHSAGKWHAYQDQLQPVLEKLQPFIDAFGYSR